MSNSSDFFKNAETLSKTIDTQAQEHQTPPNSADNQAITASMLKYTHYKPLAVTSSALNESVDTSADLIDHVVTSSFLRHSDDSNTEIIKKS